MNSSRAKGFSTFFVSIVVGICALPPLLNFLGVNFSLTGTGTTASGTLSVGSFLHLTSELMGITTGILTASLALVYYRLKKDIATPIIALALVWAATMDSFHVLTSSGCLGMRFRDQGLMAVSGSVATFFSTLTMAAGLVGSLLLTRVQKRSNFYYVLGINVIFAGVAYVAISTLVHSPALMQNEALQSNLTLIYDLPSVFLFVLTGLFIFYPFHKKEQTLFSHALLLSLIPHAFAEIYLAFVSAEVFDNAYNIAHFYKVLAYLVPFSGVILEYIRSFRNAEEAAVKRYQETLRKSEEYYRTVTQTAADAIVSTDADQIIRLANHSAERIFGYSTSELIGRPLASLFKFEAGVSMTALGKPEGPSTGSVSRWYLKLRGLHKRGHALALEVAFSDFDQDGRHAITAVIRDISIRSIEPKKVA